MSISSTSRKAGPYACNGVTTTFSFPFKVFEASDLLVVLTDLSDAETELVLNTGYTVSLNADQNVSPGGTITTTATHATGYKLTITTAVPETQGVTIPNGGAFHPGVLNDALDRLTIIAQQLKEKLGRSLTLPLSMPSNVGTSLPLPSPSKVIGWNSAGDALVNLNAADLATQVIGATNIVDVFSGTGSQTAFTLSADPLSINNTDVFISGVHQARSTYSLVGTVLTFTVAPPAGTDNIEITQAQAQTYPVSSLIDGIVTTSKIADASVTPAKVSGFGSWVTAATAALARAALGLGNGGSVNTANNAVVIDGTGKLPAVDGSLLTGVTSTLADGSVTPEKLAQKITLGSSVNSTSGVAIDFTSIPSWVKRITLVLSGVSASGASDLFVRLGSGSVQATGYTCGGSYGSSAFNDTTSFKVLSGSAASAVISGTVTLINVTGNVWAMSSCLGLTGQYSSVAGGSVTLSGVLDRLRFGTLNGTDTFDAGSINILYE